LQLFNRLPWGSENLHPLQKRTQREPTGAVPPFFLANGTRSSFLHIILRYPNPAFESNAYLVILAVELHCL
jgi:hypothetical protein